MTGVIWAEKSAMFRNLLIAVICIGGLKINAMFRRKILEFASERFLN